ncbi:hypothetical protein KH5_12160 [Urechidicola sp. KH5]
MRFKLSLLLFVITISNIYSQEKELEFLQKNISKFDFINELSYAAGYSLVYSYTHSIENGRLTQVSTYVKTNQDLTQSAHLDDLIQVEKVVDDGNHEYIKLIFKKDAVSWDNGGVQEKREEIFINLCKKSYQPGNMDSMKCTETLYQLSDEFPKKIIKAFEQYAYSTKQKHKNN